MVRKCRYGRAKDRTEFSAPGWCENASLQIERPHAGGSINRAVCHRKQTAGRKVGKGETVR
jgi:hypothetical protein